MRIELRDDQRQRLGRVDLDSAKRPTRVAVEDSVGVASQGWRWIRTKVQRDNPESHDGNEPKSLTANGSSRGSKEVFLNWDTALDDAGQLRRCLSCGCTELFREKSFPQVTGFVVLLAFIGAVVGALGLATNLPVLAAMAGVLVLDVAILVLSRRRLVCYRCRTTYLHLPIARYHRPWDRAVAERYPSPASAKPAVARAASEFEPAESSAPQSTLRAQKGSLA